MNNNCTYKECQEDWNEKDPKCLCGEPDYRNCINHISHSAAEIEQKKDIVTSKAEDETIEWSGTAIGSLDVELLSSRKRPFIIGVIGHYNSGKTTFLATLYMLLRSGKSINGYQ